MNENGIWTSEEDEILIEFVRNQEALNNVKCKDYRKAQLKQNLWSNIGTILLKSGSSDGTDWQSTKIPKVPKCSLCKNHNEISIRKFHQCPYSACSCLPCKTTRDTKNIMLHQQRLWRHQKSKLKNYQNYPDINVDEDLIDDNGQLKRQVCDMCRNHQHLTKKKNHICPYIVCKCEFCFLTIQRREVVKKQRRVCGQTKNTMPTLQTDSKDYQSEKDITYKKHYYQNSVAGSSKDSLGGDHSLYSESASNITSTDPPNLPFLIPIRATSEFSVKDEPIKNAEQHLNVIPCNQSEYYPEPYSPFDRYENSMASMEGQDESSPPPPQQGVFEGVINNNDWLNLHPTSYGSNSFLSRTECSMSLQMAMNVPKDTTNIVPNNQCSRASPPPLIPFD